MADRIWRVRVYNQSVYLARENDARTGFEDDVFLTAIPFEPVESDTAFDQAARLFVCAESAGHIWFYWFKPSVGNFVFEDFGLGHSPRCTLDQLTNRDDSDLHVFYFRGTQLYYRVQRENYSVEHATGFIGATTSYVEDAGITKGGRVQVLISNVDADGHYSFQKTYSTLLPYGSDRESWIETLALINGDLHIVLYQVGPPSDGFAFQDDVESWHEALSIISGILAEPLIKVGPPGSGDPYQDDVESWHEGLNIQSGALPVVVITHTTYDVEQWHEGLTIQSGTIAVVVIVHTTFDVEQWHEGLTIISGTLV